MRFSNDRLENVAIYSTTRASEARSNGFIEDYAAGGGAALRLHYAFRFERRHHAVEQQRSTALKYVATA